MNPEFWLRKWEKQEIGFHQQDTNPYLLNYWPGLKLAPGSPVLVPLCGKSQDMLWLRAQGHPVLGVELSPLAVESFFAENELTANQSEQNGLNHYETDGLVVLQGDFFALTAGLLQNIKAVFDRAALVALPEASRRRYAEHLLNNLPADAKILLVVFEYDQTKMDGPPFSVTEQEIHQLYDDQCTVTLLYSQDMIAENPQFKARGLEHLQEKVYLIETI